MKNILFLLILLLALPLSAQQRPPVGLALNTRWDVEHSFTGSTIYLDLGIRKHDSLAYVTLSFAKDSAASRPRYLQAIVPAPVDEKQGLYIGFGNEFEPSGELKIVESAGAMIPFIDSNSQFSTARASEGMTTSADKKKIDLFKGFQDYAYAFILFFDDKDHFSAVLPLDSFKETWKSLP